MRILIIIFLVIFLTNVKAQTPYDRKQNAKGANSDLKIVKIQNDIAALKIKTAQ